MTSKSGFPSVDGRLSHDERVLFHAVRAEPVPDGIQGSIFTIARAVRSVDSLASNVWPCYSASLGCVKQVKSDEGDWPEVLLCEERLKLRRLPKDVRPLR